LHILLMKSNTHGMKLQLHGLNLIINSLKDK